MDCAELYSIMLDKLADNSLESIIAAASNYLNQRITVLDTSYRVLASWPKGDIGDIYWDAQQRLGYVPEENIRMIFENKYPDATFEGISYVDWGNVNIPRCVSTLQHRGRALGHLSLYHTDPSLSVEDLKNACACVEQVVKVFIINNNRISTNNDTIMSALVSRVFLGQNPGADFSGEWLEASGHALQGYFTVAAMSDQSLHKSMIDIFTSRLDSVYKYTASAEIDGYWYVLFYNLNSEIMLDNVLAKLRDYLHFYGMRCGVSDPFDSLDAVRHHMFQARRAHSCHVNDLAGPITLYGDVRTYVMLDYVIENVAPANFSHQLFLKLKREDAQNGTSYYQTLMTYLECMLDSAAAAEKLNIHRNTLLYRINHIQDESGHDFSDSVYVRDLLLSAWVCARHAQISHFCEDSQKSGKKF